MVTNQRELTLQELLHDPLVRVVMKRDGIAAAHFEAMFETMRRTPRDADKKRQPRRSRELA